MAQSNYRPVDGAIGIDFYNVDATQVFPLGTIAIGRDKDLGYGEFVYLKGVATCVEGHFVTYRDDYVAVLLAANAIGGVATAMAAVDTATKCGWFQKRGKAVGKVAAAFADNGLVYATATGGVADDAAVAGDRVKGALGASAIDTPSTGFAYISFYADPFMDDGAAA